MLPLVDKPIIQYGVEEAVASGIDNILLVTGRGKNAIEDHFDVSVELESFLEARGKREQLEEVRKISNMINFAYVRQGEPLGLGHAVLVTRELVGDEPFAVILGDDVIDADPPAIKQLIDVFDRLGGPVLAVERVPRDDISSYGVIAIEPNAALGDGIYQVRDLVEKPPKEEAPSDLAIIGRYVLTPDIFPALAATKSDRTGEIQLTNGLRELLKTRPIYACEVKGVRHDTGNKLGFLKAVVYFALRRPDLADKFSAYLTSLDLTAVDALRSSSPSTTSCSTSTSAGAACSPPASTPMSAAESCCRSRRVSLFSLFDRAVGRRRRLVCLRGLVRLAAVATSAPIPCPLRIVGDVEAAAFELNRRATTSACGRGRRISGTCLPADPKTSESSRTGDRRRHIRIRTTAYWSFAVPSSIPANRRCRRPA